MGQARPRRRPARRTHLTFGADPSRPAACCVGNHETEPGLGPQGYDGFLGRFVLPRDGVPGVLNTWWFRMYCSNAVHASDGGVRARWEGLFDEFTVDRCPT